MLRRVGKATSSRRNVPGWGCPGNVCGQDGSWFNDKVLQQRKNEHCPAVTKWRHSGSGSDGSPAGCKAG